MEIVIKEARVEDASTLALLARITFREAFGHLFPDKSVLMRYFANTFSVEKITSSLQKPNNMFYLAFADSLPVGYAKMKYFSPYENLDDKSPAQLQKIYVLQDFTGKGIGTLLQEKVFDEMVACKIKTLWLAVWVGNTDAIIFYKKNGYIRATNYFHAFEDLTFEFDVLTKRF